MCEFKVGDVVKRVRGGCHEGVHEGDVVTVVWANDRGNNFKVKHTGFTHDGPNYELVERKALTPVNDYTFKVGDKGKLRNGVAYEVIAINVKGLVYDRSVVVVADGAAVTLQANGRSFAVAESRWDALPPITYVWRINCSGVRNPGKAGLVDMEATRTYASEAEANAGFARAAQAYAKVGGPFKEEKK